MNRLLHIPITLLVSLVRALPLKLVARLGGTLGTLVWFVDLRHRRRVLKNLETAYDGEKPVEELRRLSRQCLSRLGEATLCALKTTVMSDRELRPHLRVVGAAKLDPYLGASETPGVVVVTGFFGNIAMYGVAARTLPWVQPVGLYRSSKSELFRRVFDELRRDSFGSLFDENGSLNALRDLVRDGGVLLGMMGDYPPGRDGRPACFFGREVLTPIGPLTFARRYRMPLFCAACFRTGPAQWRVEVGDLIPTRTESGPRPAKEVLEDMNQQLELAIRRDPANWCWLHSRWEPA